MQNEANQTENIKDFPFQTPAATQQNLGTMPPQNTLPPTPTSPSPTPPPVSNPPATQKRGFSKLLKIFVGLITLLLIILVVFFVFSKFFTGNKSTNPSLTYWGFEDESIVNPVILDFEKENPSIKVTYVKQDLSQYKDRVVVRSQGGNGPDVFLFQNTWTPMLSDILAPVPQNVITKSDFSKFYYPVASEDLIKNGAIYGIPANIDTLVMYVNKDIFNSAGEVVPNTWNDFIDTCRKLTVKDENGSVKTAGCAFGTYDNVSHAPDIVSLLFLQNGVNINNIVNSKDAVLSALNFYTSFATDSDSVWNSSIEPSQSFFAKGNLAMYFGYSLDYPSIRALSPSLNMQILPVPQLSENKVDLANYWAMGVSQKSKFQKESMQFVQFMSKPEVLQKIYQEEVKQKSIGELFPRVDMGDNLKTSFLYASILQAPYAHSSPLTDTAGDNGLNTDLNTYLKSAVDALDSGNSSDSVFDDFSSGISQTLSKYGF